MGHLHQQGTLETPQPDAGRMYLPPIDLDSFWRESQNYAKRLVTYQVDCWKGAKPLSLFNLECLIRTRFGADGGPQELS